MGRIQRKLTDLVRPDYGIRDQKDYWTRSENYLSKKESIKDVLERDPNAKARLEEIAKEHYEKVGKKYFTGGKLSRVARYGALGANIMGAVTAGGGLLALAAGGPLSAAAAVGYGLGWILGGGVANVAADVYDAVRVQKAINEEDAPKGFLGYLKKGAKGVWQAIKSPFSKGTRKPIAEGLVANAVAHQGAGLVGKYMAPMLGGALPYAQIATMGASAQAFYRGQKKFDQQVAKYINDKVEAQFLKEHALKAPEVTPLKDRIRAQQKLQPVYAGDNVYQTMRPQQPARTLGYVQPRRNAA